MKYRPVPEIEAERRQVAQDLQHLETRRSELKARVVLRNRMSGVNKREIANMRAQCAELLEDCERLKRRLHTLKDERREANRALSDARAGKATESVAQAFVSLASSLMPDEMFREVMDAAKERVGED
jgi:chromosome segregation ATPase